jgi:hypothetical protein
MKESTCELTRNRGGDFTAGMRFLMIGVLVGMIVGAGCFHRKAAAPRENFSEVPGMPPTPAPAPAEMKPKAQRQQAPPKEAKAKVTKAKEAKAQAQSVPEAKAPSQQLIVTPENGLTGKVEMVNQNARYVVLSFPIGHLPAMEQRLNVYRRGLKVGEVKVSGPQIEDNVVADIVEGDSAAGDEVRDK